MLIAIHGCIQRFTVRQMATPHLSALLKLAQVSVHGCQAHRAGAAFQLPMQLLPAHFVITAPQFVQQQLLTGGSGSGCSMVLLGRVAAGFDQRFADTRRRSRSLAMRALGAIGCCWGRRACRQAVLAVVLASLGRGLVAHATEEGHPVQRSGTTDPSGDRPGLPGS